MTAFIEEHRGVFGVEPMCKMLQVAPSTYYERRAIARDPDRASRRAKSDAALCVKIDAAWEANRKLYGARKIVSGALAPWFRLDVTSGIPSCN